VTQPVPEESNEALHLTEPPADEHGDELPDQSDGTGGADPATQDENAETALDQPSDGAG
jgi:hypothetical protein